MPLNDTRIRNAKPKTQAYKLSDGGGMYLLIAPSGACYWLYCGPVLRHPAELIQAANFTAAVAF